MQNQLLTVGLRFDGPAYAPGIDQVRLARQIGQILFLMLDNQWRTLAEIEQATGYPQSSISAQLRHLREPRFGAYVVEKRRRVPQGGTWEYRVLDSSVQPTPSEQIKEQQQSEHDNHSGH